MARRSGRMDRHRRRVGALFLVSLIVLLVVSHWIGGAGARLGARRRRSHAGLVFGSRGVRRWSWSPISSAGMVFPVDRWPPPVLEARTLPLAMTARSGQCEQLPETIARGSIPPPAGRETTADALLRATPWAARPASRLAGSRRACMMAFCTAAAIGGRQAARGMRRVRRLERARRRRGHRPRPARAAASRAGGHRHRQLRRRALPLASRAWAWSATISAMPG